MSLVAIFGGIAGYLWLRQRQARGQFLRTPGVSRFDGRQLFESMLLALTRGSRVFLRVCSTRRLQPQLFAVIASGLLLALLAARGVPLDWGIGARLPPSHSFVLLWNIGMVCSVAPAALATFPPIVANPLR